MEENREMWSQEEKRGEKMIMEIDVIAQVTALRISELLRTINGKQRGYSTKLNRQKKKKHMCSIWHFCTAAAGFSC